MTFLDVVVSIHFSNFTSMTKFYSSMTVFTSAWWYGVSDVVGTHLHVQTVHIG